MKCPTCAHIDCHASTCPDDPAKFCEWGQYCFDDVDSSLWHTACHEAFCFTDEGPISNGFKFCPYCGKNMKESPFVDDDAE